MSKQTKTATVSSANLELLKLGSRPNFLLLLALAAKTAVAMMAMTMRSMPHAVNVCEKKQQPHIGKLKKPNEN